MTQTRAPIRYLEVSENHVADLFPRILCDADHFVPIKEVPPLRRQRESPVQGELGWPRS